MTEHDSGIDEGIGRRPYRFRIDLPAEVASVGTARHFVRASLHRLETSSADAELAVSEMFTAALADAVGGDRIEIEVRRRGDEIDIDVSSTHGRHDLDPVQRAVMKAVGDFYDRRDIGDTEVQSYGYALRQRPARASTIGANVSGSRTT